jgi:hypothetical protein
MNISSNLAYLNHERFQLWDKDHQADSAHQAILSFKGDVYQGFDAESLKEEDLEYAQNHLRILSGLYGMLKPLDLIMPYRLEMGTKYAAQGYKNLYAYWKEQLRKDIITSIEESGNNELVNLASHEYFKALDLKGTNIRLINISFLDRKDDIYKMISFWAKKARGIMARYIAKRKINNAEELKLFNDEGYEYNEGLSEDSKFVFTRG